MLQTSSTNDPGSSHSFHVLKETCIKVFGLMDLGRTFSLFEFQQEVQRKLASGRSLGYCEKFLAERRKANEVVWANGKRGHGYMKVGPVAPPPQFAGSLCGFWPVRCPSNRPSLGSNRAVHFRPLPKPRYPGSFLNSMAALHPSVPKLATPGGLRIAAR